MTSRFALAAAVCLALALPARAQLAPRSVALEVLVSAPLAHGAPAAHAAQALAATVWLDGSLDLVARVASGDAPRTAGRGTDRWWSGTAGLRWSLAPGSLRPQVGVEAGWAAGAGGGAHLGATGALEWFPVRDLGARLEAAIRHAPGAGGVRGELGFAGVFYF